MIVMTSIAEESNHLDLDAIEARATSPDFLCSGGGYQYIEVFPEELVALVTEIRRLRDHNERLWAMVNKR